MSRTYRSTKHWPHWLRRWWTEEFRLRCERNQDSVCKLWWPTEAGWQWQWMDEPAEGTRHSRRWLKRHNSKFRRRQGKRYIQEQLLDTTAP